MYYTQDTNLFPVTAKYTPVTRQDTRTTIYKCVVCRRQTGETGFQEETRRNNNELGKRFWETLNPITEFTNTTLSIPKYIIPKINAN